MQGTSVQMPVSSIRVLFLAWGTSWAQSILASPHPHSPPSVMSPSRAHCPPLPRHETSWGRLHPLSPLPGHLACLPGRRALQCTGHPLFPRSQPSLPPLSTPAYGLPKQPAPSPNSHCKGTTNPLQLVPSTFLNFSSCCPPWAEQGSRVVPWVLPTSDSGCRGT